MPTLLLGQSSISYWTRDKPFTKKVLKKAYEIFIHALKYDVEKAWGCPKCPLPLGSNEHETNFDGINEVHIADG